MIKIRSFLILLVFLGLGFTGKGQSFGRSQGGSTNIDSLIIDLADYLPPLNMLIDSAVANAPAIDYYRQRQLMFEYEMAAFNKDWMSGVRFGAGYTIGSNALIENGLALAGYNYGVSVYIPLSTFFGQRDKAKASLAASASENAKRKETELSIRKEVEETYSRLFMLRDLIKEATNAKESSQFIYEQSEERYVNGEITINELGQLADLRSRWANNYITLKNQFYDTYRHLQRLVGVPFSKFNHK